MEAKGIRTDKGDMNRWIRRINSMRKNIASMLKELFYAIREINRELKAHKAHDLAEIIADYYSKRNAGAWSVYAKVGNLKNMSQLENYVRENNLNTIVDLEARVSAQQKKLDVRSASCKSIEAKLKETAELLRQAQNYADTKLIYDEWYRIKFKGKKDKSKEEHESELRKYYAAERKQQLHFHDGKQPLTKWRKDITALENKYAALQTEMEVSVMMYAICVKSRLRSTAPTRKDSSFWNRTKNVTMRMNDKEELNDQRNHQLIRIHRPLRLF